VILLSLIAGFFGGVIGGGLPRGTIKAREFVVVDASGTRRATLSVLPDRNTAPASCWACDGNAHLIVLNQNNPQQSQMWPLSRGTLNPGQVIEMLKLLKMVGPLL
jgi:hypothetical protein